MKRSESLILPHRPDVRPIVTPSEALVEELQAIRANQDKTNDLLRQILRALVAIRTIYLSGATKR